jgi:ABC-2 type transport system ATP-binding protein
MAAISIKNVSKTYPVPLARLRQILRRRTNPAVEALRNISFDVEQGEIFGLIGPNGAGKTTLIKIISTLVQPTEGTAEVLGSDSVRDEREVRASIGLATAEERSFYWRLTAKQNLEFYARLYGLSGRAIKERIIELISDLEIEDQATRRFGQLSTGNKQRLAVARALLAKPPILLLDEPTRSLDPLVASRIRKTIRSLPNRNPPVTVFLTSHNLSEVEEMCQRVCVIMNGRIVALDTPASLRNKHQPAEEVSLTFSISEADLTNGTLPPGATHYRDERGQVVAKFMRSADDDLLDQTVRRIIARGGRLNQIDTRRATLLEVLESLGEKRQ